MDLLQYLLQPISIAIIIIISCILIFSSKKQPNSGPYSKPDWNYFIKRIISFYYIYKIQKKLKRDWLNNGWKAEQPRKLHNDRNFDSQAFYGYDQNGNALIIKIKKKAFRIAEVWLQIYSQNGDVYKLPDYPNTCVSNKDNGDWSAHGIKFTILEPFKRIRITFNGLLEVSNVQKSQQIVHTKLNLIWSACSIPTHWPLDQDTSMLSKAISLEKWRDGNWLKTLTNPAISGYDQYGGIRGEITLSNRNIEMILPSFRARRTGYLQDTRQYIEIMGSCHDGTLFHLGSSSNFKGLTDYKFGSVRTADGRNSPITDTDLSLKYLGDCAEAIPKIFVINLKVNGQSHRNVFYLKKELVLFSGNPWNFQHDVIPFHCSFKKSFGCGFAILGYKYQGNSNVPIIIPRNYLTFSNVQRCEDLLLTLDNKLCQSVAIVGGKAASLGLLFSTKLAQVIVPNGFCLTTSAFDKQIYNNSNITASIKDITKISIEEINELKCACQRTENIILDTNIDSSFTTTIREALGNLRDSCNISHNCSTDPHRFTVRSSGVFEDAENVSSAGQNETILGCITDEDVIQAISKCWASLFAFRSVCYRKQHGQPVNCSMGVVIQLMVPSEISGIMFTCNPTTENPAEIIISATYGLGESIVSARVDPDQFIINRSWNNDLSIKSVTLGEKKLIAKIASNNSDINYITAEQSDAKKLCLNEHTVLRLAKIGLQLQEMFNFYCDIEWSVCDNSIYLLQCRSLTTTASFTDYELTHEFDTPILTSEEIISFGNIGEVFPNAISPLHISLFSDTIETLMGMEKAPYLGDLYRYCSLHFPVYKHRLTMNLLNVILEQVGENISTTDRIACLSILGEDIMNEVHNIALKRNRDVPHTKWNKGLLYMMGALWTNKTNISKSDLVVKEFQSNMGDLNNCKTSKEVFELIEQNYNTLKNIFDVHSKASEASVIYKIFTIMILLESNKEITKDHLTDINLLLGSCKDIFHQIPKELMSISRIIKSSNKAEEFKQIPVNNILVWLRENIPEAENSLQKLLNDHGHRGIMELDVGSEPWILNPSPLFQALQNITQIAEVKENSMQSNNTNIDDLISQLITPKRHFTKLLLKYVLVPRMHSGVNIREHTKSATVLVTHGFRLAYNQLGKHLVAEGILPQSKLVFFLTYQELQQLIYQKNINLIQKAIKRRKLTPEWNSCIYTTLNFGYPKLKNTNSMVKSTEIGNSDKISINGTVVYPGIIQGRACVIKNISEACLIKKDDILITESTDIGWSPYFPLLSGIVTELGGLISHGAVIAREYSIPCLVGAKQVTEIFSTGDQVILDAKNGKIEFL